MTSPHWDENLAEAYRQFQFEFPEKALAGKTVIIAGGTGGLGAATAMLLAREGAHLIVGYRENRKRAGELSAAIEKQFSRKLTLVEGDIAEAEVRRNYLEAAATIHAPLAGAAIFPGDPARVAWQDLGRESLLASLEKNYVGPVLLARDLGEAMEKNPQGGSVVLLATMQALAVFPLSLNYAAPKAALVHAAQILAQHWSRVRVNVVAPGATVAGMAAASIQSGKYDRHIANGSISRFGRPEDVARTVRFFLEPDNYITGQALVVDGGLTLRRDRR
ncbi:MAG TPA: SDR family oxidoreductase [Candidatus Limnocylindria bacterium]|nr:SDR family oxidoreductase [Candidatus Limnocylindria bacterium]